MKFETLLEMRREIAMQVNEKFDAATIADALLAGLHENWETTPNELKAICLNASAELKKHALGEAWSDLEAIEIVEKMKRQR